MDKRHGSHEVVVWEKRGIWGMRSIGQENFCVREGDSFDKFRSYQGILVLRFVAGSGGVTLALPPTRLSHATKRGTAALLPSLVYIKVHRTLNFKRKRQRKQKGHTNNET